MKVELLSAVMWDGQHRDAGEVLELSEVDGYNLIGRGRAKPYAEPEKPLNNRAVALETSDAPKPTKRTWKKTKAED